MTDGSDNAANDARLAIAAEAVRKAEERATSGLLALETIHEIKNPLEALGHLTYLTLEDADNPESVRAYMRLAQEQMALLRHIASETLGFARSTRSPVATKGVTLARAALRIHQRTIDSKRIHLVTRVSPDVTAQVYPSELLQVLSNLIVNALDALAPQGTLHLRISQRHDRVHFLIADSGHGIPVEHRKQMFQPFFSTKEALGNGLGLALSKRIIDRHGGTIRFRSSVSAGKSGTTFRISLPNGEPLSESSTRTSRGQERNG